MPSSKGDDRLLDRILFAPQDIKMDPKFKRKADVTQEKTRLTKK